MTNPSSQSIQPLRPLELLSSRLGATDLALALLLAVASIVGPFLEETYRDLWTYLPLAFAVPLLLSGLLLLLRLRVATVLAMGIHILLFCVYILLLLLCVALALTILFIGFAIVLGPPTFFLALNSAVTLKKARQSLRAPGSLP